MVILTGHASAHTPEFRAWKNMIYHCMDPYHNRWPKYGGAGITVCASWENFEVFRRDMGRRPEGHVLARKNPTGNFTPENCYWEAREKASRRYRAETLTYNGETLLLLEWSERTGLSVSRIRMRLTALGWPVGQALGLEPRQSLPHKRRKLLSAAGHEYVR